SSRSNLSSSAADSGWAASACGTFTRLLFRGADCSAANEVAGSPVTNTTVNGNGVYVSPAIHVTQAGTYRWIANYGGDANNNPTRSEERRVGQELRDRRPSRHLN